MNRRKCIKKEAYLWYIEVKNVQYDEKHIWYWLFDIPYLQ